MRLALDQISVWLWRRHFHVLHLLSAFMGRIWGWLRAKSPAVSMLWAELRRRNAWHI
jgi:hypothetical protein